jgi:Spy/CpxP family protein refolding chaperone
MKKTIIVTILAAFAAITLRAQDIPDRKREEFKPIEKERLFNKKELANLDLSDEQKTKLKSINQDLRKQAEELRKQDNLTANELREKREALHKDHLAQLQSILTPDQKAQMQKDKEARNAKMKGLGQKRQERMKKELKLTDEQSAKMTENRMATIEKIKAIRENGALKDEEKRDQVKEIMKQQKETTKSILTKEQLKKLKESRKHDKKHKGKKEVV